LTNRSHPQAVYTSRLLSFKNFPKPQNSEEINEKFYRLTEELESLRITDTIKFNEELEKRFNDLQIEENYQGKEILESEEIPPIEVKNSSCDLTKEIENLEIKTKRQLSLESQIKSNQGESKLPKMDKQKEYQLEPMEVDYSVSG
jgi:hypothetical protein